MVQEDLSGRDDLMDSNEFCESTAQVGGPMKLQEQITESGIRDPVHGRKEPRTGEGQAQPVLDSGLCIWSSMIHVATG
jgi:hypothetical protein